MKLEDMDCKHVSLIENRSKEDYNRSERPVTRLGIEYMTNDTKRRTKRFGREPIFSTDKLKQVNVLFYSDMYKKYESFYDNIREKQKIEDTIISPVAHILAKFKIFIMNGYEMGQTRMILYKHYQDVI